MTPQSEKSSWGQTSGWAEREGEEQGALLGQEMCQGRVGPPEDLPDQRGGKRGGLAAWSGLRKSPAPPGAVEGVEGRRDALALRGSERSKSRIYHIPWRPWLPSYWAWKSPRGAGWSQGWKNWSSSPPPPSAWSSREGVGRNWRFPTFHRGWEWDRSRGGEKAEEAHGRRNKEPQHLRPVREVGAF